MSCSRIYLMNYYVIKFSDKINKINQIITAPH